jgi:hypothetical protein
LFPAGLAVTPTAQADVPVLAMPLKMLPHTPGLALELTDHDVNAKAVATEERSTTAAARSSRGRACLNM